MALDVTPTIGPATGIGHHVAGLLAAFSGRPEAVEIIPMVLSWSGRSEGGATHRPLPAKLRQLWRRMDVPPIEWFVGDVDVVHGTNFVVPPAKRAVEVVTVHDLTPVKYPELTLTANHAFAPLVKRAVRRGSWIHAVSHSVAAEVAEWLPEARPRIRTVYAGVPTLDIGDLSGLDPRLISVLGPGRRMVLSVGTEEPRKGLLTLFDALEEVFKTGDDIISVHAGPRGWQSDQIDRRVAELPRTMQDRIFRLGYVSGPQRTALLERATVFAYPSVYEGFGLPPLEAMAVGTPVVASNIAVLREVLGDTATLIAVGDSDALASGLIDALGLGPQPNLIAARQARASRYRWDTMASGVIGLYREALASRG